LRDRVWEFLTGLTAQGFLRPSLQDFARRLRAFGEFAERHGVGEPAHLDGHVEPFVRPIHRPRKRRAWGNFLHRFARFAAPEPTVPAQPAVQQLGPHAQLVEG
jgi:hypothetical protein